MRLLSIFLLFSFFLKADYPAIPPVPSGYENCANCSAGLVPKSVWTSHNANFFGYDEPQYDFIDPDTCEGAYYEHSQEYPDKYGKYPSRIHWFKVICDDDPCDDNETWNVEEQTCFQNCAEYGNAHYDPALEECICNNGRPMINGVCQVPDCPSVYNGLPLQHRLIGLSSSEMQIEEEDCTSTPDVTHIEFLKESSSGLACCYYTNDPVDSNVTCGPGEVRVGDQCFEAGAGSSDPDENNTNPANQCAINEYYSIIEGKCVPMFPENNNTGDSGSNGNSGSGGGDNNGEGNNSNGSNGTGGAGGSNDDNDSGLLQEIADNTKDIADFFNFDFSDLVDDILEARDSVKNAINNATESVTQNFEELQGIIRGLRTPQMSVHGSCSITFTVFNKTVDLSNGMVKVIPVLRPFLMLILNVYFALLLMKLSILAFRDASDKFMSLYSS